VGQHNYFQGGPKKGYKKRREGQKKGGPGGEGGGKRPRHPAKKSPRTMFFNCPGATRMTAPPNPNKKAEGKVTKTHPGRPLA